MATSPDKQLWEAAKLASRATALQKWLGGIGRGRAVREPPLTYSLVQPVRAEETI